MPTGKKIEKIDIDNAVSKLSSFTAPSLMNAYASTPYGIVKIINGKMTKATERVLKALKTGRKWHSKELFAVAETWDWRKAVSNAKKELRDYEWHTEQADKGMKYYWITPICDAQRVFGDDNHSTDCNK